MQSILDSSELNGKFTVEQLHFAANFVDIKNEEFNADQIDILERMKEKANERRHGEATSKALLKLRIATAKRQKMKSPQMLTSTKGVVPWSTRILDQKHLSETLTEINLSNSQTSSLRASMAQTPLAVHRRSPQLVESEKDAIEERLTSLPYCNIFSQAAKPLGQKKSDSNKSMGGRLTQLNSRDLSAYLTKLSWPAKLYKEPIRLSESYTNPHMQPNPCVGDSDEVAYAKKQQVITNDFLAYYLGEG